MSSPDLNSLLESSTTKKLFDERIVVLSEAIHGVSAKRVIEQLLAFDSTNSSQDIWLFLNSPGGEVSSGYAIYDTMRFVRAPIKVIVTGLAASIATVILLGAKKEFRFSLPNARLLIHQPLVHGSIQGQASDIEIHAKEILKTREKIAQLYQQETKQPIDRIQRDMERDYWMTAPEAQEYGLIHQIAQNWAHVK
jgi:ATP-dependent Clp protease protease subunit